MVNRRTWNRLSKWPSVISHNLATHLSLFGTSKCTDFDSHSHPPTEAQRVLGGAMLLYGPRFEARDGGGIDENGFNIRTRSQSTYSQTPHKPPNVLPWAGAPVITRKTPGRVDEGMG